MLTLEELDEKIKNEPPPEETCYGKSWWERQREKEEKENKYLVKGECPHCPRQVAKEASKYVDGGVLYKCTDGHTFFRYNYVDIR